MEPDKKSSKKLMDGNEESDMINQKLESLQKKNRAESIALRKLLHGLENIGKASLEEEKPKRKKKK